jgi:hypothetical protein
MSATRADQATALFVGSWLGETLLVATFLTMQRKPM